MRHIIVGNGVAGITAATELARRQAGQIVIYGAEPYPYYYRPRLPYFLAGDITQEQLVVHPDSWYESKGIEIHRGTTVARLSTGQKSIALADGTEVPYDRLLIASGAVSFVPPIEGVDKRGAFTLRTLDDAVAIRDYAARCQRAVVVGGGLLGLEAAKGLKGLGLEVTVLEYTGRLLPRQLDVEGAAVFQGLVKKMGLQVALGADTKAILGDGEAAGVLLKDGREFPAQLVLIATGVRCNSRLAAEAGLPSERGIVVDERMVTAAPDVYAAGDVASFHGRSWGIIPVAMAQAAVAAANMAGESSLYQEVVPSNTLKIAGIDLTSCGTVVPEGEGLVEVRPPAAEKGAYRKLVLKEGTLVGAIVIGNRALARKVEGLVISRARMGRKQALELISEP